MLHKDAVRPELLDIVRGLCKISDLQHFRLVGGTAIALHLGHRLSIDVDFFSTYTVLNEKTVRALDKQLPGHRFTFDSNFIASVINGVKTEICDSWHVPFKKTPLVQDGMRLARLEDLAAFKVSAMMSRKEKKDYVDLFFPEKEFGIDTIFRNFKNYQPYFSERLLVAGLDNVKEARNTNMPIMLKKITWEKVESATLKFKEKYLQNERTKSKRKMSY